MTIGNFLHAPNLDAVYYLKEKIWPGIRKKCPDSELHIYGSYQPQKLDQLNDASQGFYIKGRAVNAREVMQDARVCLAPLRFGAGLKGKLIESMLTGTPSVTTGIGAEAMHAELPWNGCITDDTDKFILEAANLYLNEADWQQAQINGISIINSVNLF